MAADESKKKVDEVAAGASAADEAAPAVDDAATTADETAPAAKPAKTTRPRTAKSKAAPSKAAAKTDKPEKAAKAAKPKAAKPRTAGAKAATPEPAEAAAPEAGESGAVAPEPVEGEAPAKAEKPSRLRRARGAKAKPVKAAPKAKAERPPKIKVERPVHEPRRGAAGKATVVDGGGKELESRDLAPVRFAVPADVNALHLVVRAEQAARRRGTASTKTRGEVSGSTAKLFRQKGTGRARAGSIKSPVRTGGGIAFGPKPRSHDIKVNRKVVKKALAMALSNRAENGNVFVAAGLDLETPSTRRLNDVLAAIDCAAPVLVVTHDEPVIAKSARNLFYAETAEVAALSTEQVLRARSLVLTEKAFDALNQA